MDDDYHVQIPLPRFAPEDVTVEVEKTIIDAKVGPFEIRGFEPYVTGGLGSFTSDTVVSDVTIGTTRFEDRRRTTDFATNVGAGVNYRINDWVGVGADYRTFFVHRDNSTPRVHRFTTGLTFSLQ